MEPKKTKDIFAILKMLEKLGKMTTIDESLIEEGIILKSTIYEDEDCTVAVLVLAPGSKIKEHEHTKDSEVYFLFKTGEFKKCEIGQSHSLENSDSENCLPVISIKYKKK